MLYVLFRRLFYILYRLLFRFEAVGQENIPDQGAVLLCSNHISNLDPPVIGIGLRRKVSFMAKQELFKIPVLSFLIRSFGAFPVKRNATDKQALKKGLSLLKEGEILGIFPEGTRSKTGKLGKAYSGVGLFALKEDATVIPAAIIGPYRLFRKVKVIYGTPVPLDDFKQTKVDAERVKSATERIMSEIQKILDTHQKNINR